MTLRTHKPWVKPHSHQHHTHTHTHPHMRIHTRIVHSRELHINGHPNNQKLNFPQLSRKEVPWGTLQAAPKNKKNSTSWRFRFATKRGSNCSKMRVMEGGWSESKAQGSKQTSTFMNSFINYCSQCSHKVTRVDHQISHDCICPASRRSCSIEQISPPPLTTSMLFGEEWAWQVAAACRHLPEPTETFIYSCFR